MKEFEGGFSCSQAEAQAMFDRYFGVVESPAGDPDLEKAQFHPTEAERQCGFQLVDDEFAQGTDQM